MCSEPAAPGGASRRPFPPEDLARLLTEAGPGDAVAGVQPRWVARPDSAAEVSALLAAASAAGLAVTPRGAGGRLDYGAPPERLDLVLDLGGLNRIVEYAPGDLIVVAEAGVRLAELAPVLAEHAQRLGIDAPRPDGAAPGTVGGAVAAGLNGPRRLFHGGVRDLVIGATMARADGVLAASGGKVVKNVAGYDLGKLLCGSLGTLGVLTRVAFRLHPVQPRTAYVRLAGRRSRVLAGLPALTHTQAFPSAAELDVTGAAAELWVELEGTEAGVAERADGLAARLGAGAEVRDAPPPWWGTDPAAAVTLRATHTLTGIGPLLAAAAAAGLERVRSSVLVGTSVLAVDEPAEAGAALAALRQADAGGHVSVLSAPSEVSAAVDVWGPVSGLALMRAVKDRFDPARVLSPGRFVGGI